MSLNEYPNIAFNNGEEYAPAGAGSISKVGFDGSLFVQAFPGVESLTVTRVHSPITLPDVVLLMDFFRQNFGRSFYAKDAGGTVYRASFAGIPTRQHIRGPYWAVVTELILTDENLEEPE